MPIYEFKCPTCQRKSSFFARSVVEELSPSCPACGNKGLVRTISSFAYHKSMKTVHEESGEPSFHPSADYYKDPRNIGRWTEKRFKEMEMEMPDHIQQMVNAARDGEMPDTLKDLKSAKPDASYH